jgi:hypothetical protein
MTEKSLPTARLTLSAVLYACMMGAIPANAWPQGQSDDRAVPRGSSEGPTAGPRHRDSGTASAPGSSSSERFESPRASSDSRGGSGDSRVRSRSNPDAASRRPRPGTGSGDRAFRGGGEGRYWSAPYSGYYYDPYSYSWRYGFRSASYPYGFYDYGYSYGGYYGYYPYRVYRYREGNIAQLRVIVEPSKTRVYVDGYYAGTADDFDGIFQRLAVTPGRHDITLKLEGYKTHTFKIYANREQTLKLRFDMIRGAGESEEQLGGEAPAISDREREFEQNRDRLGPDGEPRYVPPTSRERGLVSFEVEPEDASIYVDGEFYGKASELRSLDLPLGRRRIEVVRPGYKTAEMEITVEAGRNPAVHITLQKP